VTVVEVGRKHPDNHRQIGTGPLLASREGEQPRFDLPRSIPPNRDVLHHTDTAAVLENLPKIAPVEIP
jgi:hypothetical protein